MRITVDYNSYSTDIDSATLTQTVEGVESKLKLRVTDNLDAKKFTISDVSNEMSDLKFDLTFSQLKQLNSLITQFMKQVAK